MRHRGGHRRRGVGEPRERGPVRPGDVLGQAGLEHRQGLAQLGGPTLEFAEGGEDLFSAAGRELFGSRTRQSGRRRDGSGRVPDGQREQATGPVRHSGWQHRTLSTVAGQRWDGTRSCSHDGLPSAVWERRAHRIAAATAPGSSSGTRYPLSATMSCAPGSRRASAPMRSGSLETMKIGQLSWLSPRCKHRA